MLYAFRNCMNARLVSVVHTSQAKR